jgi:hypothetical protein
MTAGERDLRLRQLKEVQAAERGVLANARCLNEGVDVPTLDAVAFIDPRRSQVDVVQAVGRAIRKAPEKITGTIIIPVFVSDNIDPVQQLETSEFDRVWQVVRALRDHDDVLAEQLDECRRELGRSGTLGNTPDRIVFDLPTGVGMDFARAFDARLIDRTTPSWEFNFGLLASVVAREGTALLRRDHLERGVRLGGWISEQRVAYRTGSLRADRIERLEALPGWAWDSLDAAWDEGYGQLVAYAALHGTGRVPASYKAEDGYRLGDWVRGQRKSRRTLSVVRIRRLESTPGWTWDPFADDWENKFTALQSFLQREGPRSFRNLQQANQTLYAWVINQRVDYRRGELTQDRARRLTTLPGWVWQSRDRWDEKFALLERFAEREGHAEVPFNHIEEETKLGHWVANQRRRRQRGLLASEQISRLDALSLWSWHARRDSWERSFQVLQRFVERTGDARVPREHTEDGFRLGAWVKEQRGLKAQGKLRADRAVRLEALPGWSWRPSRDAWSIGFSHLCRFAEREGHAHVPPAWCEDDYRLGQWVRNQRAFFRAGRLSPIRAGQLEELPGWVWNVRRRGI